MRAFWCFPHDYDVPCSDRDRIFRILEGETMSLECDIPDDLSFEMHSSLGIVCFLELDSWILVFVSAKADFLLGKVVGPTVNSHTVYSVAMKWGGNLIKSGGNDSLNAKDAKFLNLNRCADICLPIFFHLCVLVEAVKQTLSLQPFPSHFRNVFT